MVGYLVACLVLGGGTREGFLADVALQVCAVPLLLWSIWRLLDVPPEEGGKRGRVAILACVLIVAFPLVQLMPLPPSIWISLPGRGDFESNLVAAGLEVGWLPLSLSPRATWLSALALLPPIAVFLGTLLLGYADRRRLSLVLLLIGLLSACLGLLQVAQGSASPLRFYAFTNTSDSVGFFANRNHYSALLYCLILFAAAWAVSVMATVARDGLTLRLLRRTPDLIAVLASFTILVVLIGAQAMARSRAGLGLTIVAMLGALAMAYLTPIGEAERDHHKHRSAAARRSRQLLIGAIAVAALIVVQFALYRIQSRFELDALSDARLPFARNTIEAAIAYMPFGSGMGTFVSIYPAFEKATDNVVNVYANRAHNDYLEFWLEGGVVALVAMFLFLVWIIGVFLRLWRYGLPGARHRDNLLACAAVLSLILLLAHSTVDYPLRTTALLAIAACAMAMVAAPVGARETVIAAAEDIDVTDGEIGRSRHRRGRSSGRRRRETPVGERDEGWPTLPQNAGDQSPRFVPTPPRDDWPVEWQPARPRDKPDHRQ
jgi:O-antigen ligase